jgi:citrate synthase
LEQLNVFKQILSEWSALPNGFTEDMIIKAPSRDVMNKLARSVLALYSYESTPDDTSLEAELLHAVKLIARCPTIVAHAFSVKQHYFDNQSLYLHRPQPNLSIAENFLYSVRHDNRYTAEEARLLDLCLVLHAEHGGGNNSAFACRVVSSSGTDFFSAIAAAIGSLKGPRHGGANNKVMEMMTGLEKGVADWKDDEEVRAYLQKIVSREAGDGSGLIYGMGHAIYTISDPRAVTLKKHARRLAKEKGMLDELELFETVERLAPEVLAQIRGEDKTTCANVDLYSGLIYKMMDIPEELYTPLFAIARMAGWCSHRIEEVSNSKKIIRPAYKALAPHQTFIPLSERK